MDNETQRYTRELEHGGTIAFEVAQTPSGEPIVKLIDVSIDATELTANDLEGITIIPRNVLGHMFYNEFDNTKTNVRKIELPEGIEVCDCAFHQNVVLEELIIHTPCYIGQKSFSGCKKLKSVKVNASERDGVIQGMTLPFHCFASCDSLASFTYIIPNSVRSSAKKIANSLFAKGIFSGCKNLLYAKLPASVELSGYMFSGCHKLRNVQMYAPNENPSQDLSRSVFIHDEAIKDCPSDLVIRIGVSSVTQMIILPEDTLENHCTVIAYPGFVDFEQFKNTEYFYTTAKDNNKYNPIKFVPHMQIFGYLDENGTILSQEEVEAEYNFG